LVLFFSFLLFFFLWSGADRKKQLSHQPPQARILPMVSRPKKIKKNLKKYLFFLKKVLTFGISDAIMSIATTKQLNTKTAPAQRVAKATTGRA
jgi:hypothetical protein